MLIYNFPHYRYMVYLLLVTIYDYLLKNEIRQAPKNRTTKNAATSVNPNTNKHSPKMK